MSAIKRVIVVQNTVTDTDDSGLNRVQGFLKQQGIETYTTTVGFKDCPLIPPEVENPQLVIVLGGDGTFLRTAQCFVRQQIPLVGVNTGTLGFLARIAADSVEDYLQKILSGHYWIEERMMLAINGGEQLALNDVVIKNANPSQMATLRFFVNEQLIAEYDADGIILSTPTGSTAYTLSAGGPVISPEVEAVSITPICPHSLSAKPVILPATKTLRVESISTNKSVVCAVDGQEIGALQPGQSLTITKAPQSLPMVNFEKDEDDFYILLRNKLHWAMNPRRRSNSTTLV